MYRIEAQNLLKPLLGYVIPRETWSVSSTGTLANHDVNMDAAEDWISVLDDPEAEIIVREACTQDAEEIAVKADRNAGLNGTYDGYQWVKIELKYPPRGMRDGMLTTLYVPVSGFL